MKHLVISVSPDSSLELLGSYADIIVLDKQTAPDTIPFYETIYLRSHFGSPETLPQVFRTEIEGVIHRAKQVNPNLKFIDDTGTVNKVLDIEDKWRQYEIFKDFMPKTTVLGDDMDVSGFERPVFKKRLSSHGNGVTWNIEDTTVPRSEWLIQESIDIIEELRVYVIKGEVYPVGAIRQSKTNDQATQAVDSRVLEEDEIEFSFRVGNKATTLDMIGIDLARTSSGKLFLMEVNRSPGFGKFAELSGVNLASVLYDERIQS